MNYYNLYRLSQRIIFLNVFKHSNKAYSKNIESSLKLL